MPPETNHYHFKNNLCCLSLHHLAAENAPVNEMYLVSQQTPISVAWHRSESYFIPPLVERGLYCNHLVRPSVRSFVTDISASTGRNDFIFDIWLWHGVLDNFLDWTCQWREF